uniref:imidazole glycerol phosphate synthase subunit HisH n=1 Tax=Algoriphagus sp. TaxID=1872435 RepID=UPI0040487B90
MIGIINYGSGNLSAFVNVFKSLEKKTTIINAPEDLKNCSHILMPGVSAWDTTMQSVNKFKETLLTCVFNNKVPFLGVCVGMQILASTSEEGKMDGLKWIDGNVRRLPVDRLPQNETFSGPKLPHMGWNTVVTDKQTELMARLPENPEFYFLHSYFFDANNKDNIVATSEHIGFNFPVVVQNENIFGLQFHPEKSHINGKMLLENFSNL